MPLFRRNRNELGHGIRVANYFKWNPLSDCSEKWLTKGVIVTVFCILVVVLLLLFQPFQNEHNVLLLNSRGEPVAHISPQFLSVALDASLIAEAFHGFNMTDQRVISTLKYLGGGYLRVGGTMADGLTFDPYTVRQYKARRNVIDGDECAYEDKICTALDRPNFTMSGMEWDMLNKLAIKTNWTILFDLNCLMRNSDGSWNSNNAEELIRYSNQRKYNILWELGNEPNAFLHNYNYEVNATQLAKDFIALKKILNKYDMYRRSILVGPDITKPKAGSKRIENYLSEFLDKVGENTIDAITWHHYYFNGKDAFLYYFINPDVFNTLQKEINIIKDVVVAKGFKNTPIWLGETSSAYGGGASSFSDRYVSTFIWMDKLGLSALNGIDVVVRQSFFKGYYALINDFYEPNPDWWLSILYKRLVGQKVIECLLAAPADVRMYCHCNGPNSYTQLPAITVYGMNMKNTDAVVRIQEVDSDVAITYNIQAFILQTHISVLSRYVYLNDDILNLINNEVPTFVPVETTTNTIVIPPFSLGFWIVSSNTLTACY